MMNTSQLHARRRPLSALLTILFATHLALPVMAQTAAQAGTQTLPQARSEVPPPPVAGQSEEMQPKFIWGLVLNVAFKLAMTIFSDWLANKITNDLHQASSMQKLLLNATHAVIVPLADAAPFGRLGSKSAGAPENTVAGEPNKPVTVENGKENFQGVHVAVVGFNKAGEATGIQPVIAGFRTGDRIKLKVLPTFEGLLVIENINPRGERQQIYPPRSGDVVKLKAGLEVLLPLAREEYFEFAGATGEDQLIITIRDPRAFGGNESKAVANRKDEKNGSSFVQEVAPGTYPLISQSLKFKHGV